MSGDKKIVVVFGATGAQGGSVAKFLLKDGTFKVRAVTRKLDSPAAQALVQQGAEVVQADLEDKASVTKALTGAYGVFGLTNFWDPTVLFEGEVRQGKLLTDVAKETGIQHFVWSSLDHGNVPHFESKALVDDYIKQVGVPATSLYTAFYYENFYNFPATSVVKNDKGEYNFVNPIVPDAKIPAFAVEDTGAWVLHILKHREEFLGKVVKVAAEDISMNEVAAIFEKVTGKKTTPLQIDRDGMLEYGKAGWFQQEFILNNLFFVDNPNLRDPEWSRKVYPEAQTWETFLRNHLHKFTL